MKGFTENRLKTVVRMLREERDYYRRSCRETGEYGSEVLARISNAIDELQEAENALRRKRPVAMEEARD